MTREQFKATVNRLEAFAAAKPAAYRRKVGLIAALGYGYVWMVLACVFALLAALAWAIFSLHRLNFGLLKIGLILFVSAIAIIRSLWVVFPRPEGVPITRDQAPELFGMLNELTTALQAPVFNHVLLDSDFNAAVVQRPRFGLFGWQENYLLLGLPLMQALPPDQFRAVVAHELGHLSGNHSRFAGWIYRVAATWKQLEANFSDHGNGGSAVFEKFLRWYWPLFNAYSFVLRRADEYVADRCAAQLTSARTAGDALVNIAVKAEFLNSRFWPYVYGSARTEPEPPRQTLSTLPLAFREKIQPEDVRKWTSHALREEADYSDTHPSLQQRLDALEYRADAAAQADAESRLSLNFGEAKLPGVETNSAPAIPSAADHYLGGVASDVASQMEECWREAVAEQWRLQHEGMRESREALQELADKISASPPGSSAPEALSEEELWNRARWTAELTDATTAIPLLRELLEAYPAHASARFALGSLLLESDDDSGIPVLEQAMQRERTCTLEACVSIEQFLRKHGRLEEAARYKERAEAFYDELQEAQRERTEIGPKDEFLPHELSVDELQKVRDLVRTRDRIGEAFLVQKKVRYLPEDPCYVLALVTRQSMGKFLGNEDNAGLIDAMGPHLAETEVTFLFVVDDSTKGLGKAIRKIDGSRIYSHQDDAPTASADQL